MTPATHRRGMVAKGSRKIRKAGRVVPIRGDVAAPTPEQMRDSEYTLDDVTDKGANGQSIAIGKAYRKAAMIDTLAKQGMFTDKELKALQFYRHHALLAENSPIRDSLNKDSFGGMGLGPTVMLLTAKQIVKDCEIAAGSLADILRAVVLDDTSLSAWAIKRHGSVEDCTTIGGVRVCRPKPRQKALAIAKLEIKMVARRVEAELSA